MEKFEIMKTIQSVIDRLPSNGMNFTKGQLEALNKELYNTSRIDVKFSATAYDKINLKTKFMLTDPISGISSLKHRKELI